MANEFVIKIVALGGTQAGNAIRKVAGDISVSTKDIQRHMKATGKSWQDATRDLVNNGKKATKQNKQVAQSIKAVGKEKGFDNAATSAKRYGDAVEKAHANTEKLQQGAEKMRNFGAGLAAAGAVGIAASRGFIEGAKEDTSNTEALNAMMRTRGQGGEIEQMGDWIKDIAYQSAQVDDDPIKQAATQLLTFGLNAKQVQAIMPGIIGQARVMGQDLVSVAQQFGKAFASGNAGSLKRAGVTLDPADLERLKGINDTTEKQIALFDMVKKSFEDYSLKMTEGLTEATIAANRAELAMDDMNTALGVGAQKAETQVKQLGVSIAGLILPSQQAGEAAGYIGTIGSYAAAAAGSILGIGAQLGMVSMAFPGFAAKGVAAMAAIRTAALGTSLATAAVGAGAVGAAAYGAHQLNQGIKDRNMSDEALEKKHGAWGKVWARGGKAAGSSTGRALLPALLPGIGGLASMFIGGSGAHDKRGDAAERESLRLTQQAQSRRGVTAQGVTAQGVTARGPVIPPLPSMPPQPGYAQMTARQSGGTTYSNDGRKMKVEIEIDNPAAQLARARR